MCDESIVYCNFTCIPRAQRARSPQRVARAKDTNAVLPAMRAVDARDCRRGLCVQARLPHKVTEGNARMQSPVSVIICSQPMPPAASSGIPPIFLKCLKSLLACCPRISSGYLAHG